MRPREAFYLFAKVAMDEFMGLRDGQDPATALSKLKSEADVLDQRIADWRAKNLVKPAQG